jgi:hypothetical protein
MPSAPVLTPTLRETYNTVPDHYVAKRAFKKNNRLYIFRLCDDRDIGVVKNSAATMCLQYLAKSNTVAYGVAYVECISNDEEKKRLVIPIEEVQEFMLVAYNRSVAESRRQVDEQLKKQPTKSALKKPMLTETKVEPVIKKQRKTRRNELDELLKFSSSDGTQKRIRSKPKRFLP